MNALVAELLANDDFFVGRILGEPILNMVSVPVYHLHVRPLKEDWDADRIETTEVILESGERIPVTVIGSLWVEPTDEAVNSGEWSASDSYPTIRATDMTPQQIQQARWFVQRRNGPPIFSGPPAWLEETDESDE